MNLCNYHDSVRPCRVVFGQTYRYQYISSVAALIVLLGAHASLENGKRARKRGGKKESNLLYILWHCYIFGILVFRDSQQLLLSFPIIFYIAYHTALPFPIFPITWAQGVQGKWEFSLPSRQIQLMIFTFGLFIRYVIQRFIRDCPFHFHYLVYTIRNCFQYTNVFRYLVLY